jgi:HD-GYP domain-containing protein (c-di-GMP phosphodiesterase class II)
VETARKMDLDEDYIRRIEKAGELMDIGMLRIGDEFRAEAAELNPWEKEMVRRHPVYSVEILSSVRPDWDILPLVRHHHECWNGMGYPDGLKGEAIPLGARILHVADAFVSMISYRPYQGTREAREAIVELGNHADSQFDPRVVQAFTAFMAPRAFIGIDNTTDGNAGGDKRFKLLAGAGADGAADARGFGPGGNGMSPLDALEVEALLREISG